MNNERVTEIDKAGHRHVFDLRLKHQEEVEASSSAEGRLGGYIASGRGTAEGPQIRGRVRWDAYEKSVGEYSCDSEFVGTIETEDGAEIKFDSKGFARVLDRSKTNEWTMHQGIKFESDDERYRWLNGAAGLLIGTFDMDSLEHYYQVYGNGN